MSDFGVLLLLIGVGLSVGCGVSLVRTRRFLASAYEARAQVTGLEQRRGNQNALLYHPVLRFSAQEGSVREVVSPVGSNPAIYKQGDFVTVLYDPAHPENVRIRSFLHLWLMPAVLAGLGSIFLVIGGVLLLMGRLRR